jgi:phage-related protein
MQTLNHDTVELILIAITTAAVLLEAFVLLAIFLALRHTSRTILQHVEELKSTIIPFVDNARGFLERVGPKVEDATSDIADIVAGLKAQAAEVVSSVLNTVDRAAEYVTDVVNRPVRQISGLMASIRAIVESLRGSAREPRETHSARDRDTFI